MNNRMLRMIWLLLCVGAVSVSLYHIGICLGFPYPLEYGEGVNLFWQQAIQNRTSLYPAISETSLPWVHNPYPPLGSILSSGLSGPGQHPFFSGRLLSVLGLFTVSFCLFTLLRKHLSKAAAFSILVLFACNPLILRYGALFRVDMIGLAFSMIAFTGLYSGTSTRRFLFSACMASCAILIKPTFCAAGIFVLIHFLQQRTSKGFVACAVGALIPFCLTGIWLWNRETPELLLHLWTLQKLPWSFSHAFTLFSNWVGIYGLIVACGIGALVRCKNPPLRIYALAAVLPVAFTLGIAGSQDSYFLELWMILCLALGLSLPKLQGSKQNLVTLLAVLQLIFHIPWRAPPVFTRTYGQEETAGHHNSLTPTLIDQEISKKIVAEITTLEGDILSSSPGLILSAEKALIVQVYQFGELIQSNSWQANALEQAIEQTEFTAVLLKGNAETQSDPYLPGNLQTLIASTYSLHRVIGPWHVYVRP